MSLRHDVAPPEVASLGAAYVELQARFDAGLRERERLYAEKAQLEEQVGELFVKRLHAICAEHQERKERDQLARERVESLLRLGGAPQSLTYEAFSHLCAKRGYDLETGTKALAEAVRNHRRKAILHHRTLRRAPITVQALRGTLTRARAPRTRRRSTKRTCRSTSRGDLPPGEPDLAERRGRP